MGYLVLPVEDVNVLLLHRATNSWRFTRRAVLEHGKSGACKQWLNRSSQPVFV